MKKMMTLAIIMMVVGMTACNKNQEAAAPAQTPAVTEQVATPAASEPTAAVQDAAAAVAQDAAAAVSTVVEPIAAQVEQAVQK